MCLRKPRTLTELLSLICRSMLSMTMYVPVRPTPALQTHSESGEMERGFGVVSGAIRVLRWTAVVSVYHSVYFPSLTWAPGGDWSTEPLELIHLHIFRLLFLKAQKLDLYSNQSVSKLLVCTAADSLSSDITEVSCWLVADIIWLADSTNCLHVIITSCQAVTVLNCAGLNVTMKHQRLDRFVPGTKPFWCYVHLLQVDSYTRTGSYIRVAVWHVMCRS